MKGVSLALLADKGDGYDKQGRAPYVQLAAQTNEVCNHVTVSCIGIQGASDNTAEAAVAIDHALNTYDYIDYPV